MSPPIPPRSIHRGGDFLASSGPCLKKNVLQALRKSSFQQAAVANEDERAFAVLVDRASDVTGWLCNDRHGVGFSIPYDWQGQSSQYFPDFIVRAKLGEVFHNFIVEIKGRLDDRDRAKARAGQAYCELLTEHDREPWHYLILVENAPMGREDLTWWQGQSTTEIGDLLRHHEGLPLLPSAGGGSERKPVQLLLSQPQTPQNDVVPVYNLAVAAGIFSESQSPEPIGWAQFNARRSLDSTMFLAQVVGRSMEDAVPDGSYCLFRRFEAGAAPSAVALDGRRVVVELREDMESDMGGRYTLSAGRSQSWTRTAAPRRSSCGRTTRATGRSGCDPRMGRSARWQSCSKSSPEPSPPSSVLEGRAVRSGRPSRSSWTHEWVVPAARAGRNGAASRS